MEFSIEVFIDGCLRVLKGKNNQYVNLMDPLNEELLNGTDSQFFKYIYDNLSDIKNAGFSLYPSRLKEFHKGIFSSKTNPCLALNHKGENKTIWFDMSNKGYIRDIEVEPLERGE